MKGVGGGRPENAALFQGELMSENEGRIRSCQGYEIIKSGRAGEREVVIGYNPKAPEPYVCWYGRKERGFYWGYYGSSYETVRKKWEERYQGLVSDLCGRQERRQGREWER